MNAQPLKQHGELVRYVISLVSERYEQIVLNCEAEEFDVDGEIDLDIAMIFFYVTPKASRLLGLKKTPRVKHELKPTTQLNTIIREMFYLQKKTSEYWGSFTLLISADGNHVLEFNYGKPKRMNGIIDEESYYRFGKWLDNMPD